MRKFMILMGVVLIGTMLTTNLSAADSSVNVNATAYIFDAMSAIEASDMAFSSKSIANYHGNTATSNLSFTYDSAGTVSVSIPSSHNLPSVDLVNEDIIVMDLSIGSDTGSAGSGAYVITGTMTSEGSTVTEGGDFSANGGFLVELTYN